MRMHASAFCLSTRKLSHQVTFYPVFCHYFMINFLDPCCFYLHVLIGYKISVIRRLDLEWIWVKYPPDKITKLAGLIHPSRPSIWAHTSKFHSLKICNFTWSPGSDYLFSPQAPTAHSYISVRLRLRSKIRYIQNILNQKLQWPIAYLVLKL